MIEKFKMQNKNVKLATISFILGFIALCLIITGQSFAIFSGTFTDANEQVVKLGNLEVIMKEPSTGIDLGLSPMTDVEGLLQEEVYTFTVENTGSANAKYKVLIIDDETSKASYTGTLLDKNLIKLGLEINGEEKGPLTLSELKELLNEKELKSGKKDTYKLRLWIDESANLDEISEQQVFLKLKLEADQYFSEITTLDKSGANEPVLTSNMIPVYYDETNSTWKKADENNTDKNNQWYDYDNKMWANAVTVTETNRATYLSAKAGTEISMNDINTMWVWIPRYKYTIPTQVTCGDIKNPSEDSNPGCYDIDFYGSQHDDLVAYLISSGYVSNKEEAEDVILSWSKGDIDSYQALNYEDFLIADGNFKLDSSFYPQRTVVLAQSLNILFEKGTASSGTIKCTDAVTGQSSTSETCTDTTNGGLKAGTSTYTHPAFWWDKNDNNVRETGEELTGIWVGKFEVSSNTTCTPRDGDGVGSGCNLQTIRPLIKPNVTSWRGAQLGTFFNGIQKMRESGNKYGFATTDETHMMKNMEWGAVAYLSHSKYGINKEVAINSANTYTTGCGPQSEGSTSSGSTCNSYTTTLGQSASTTGNVYGVYDMSGGAHEYMMGNMVWTNGQQMSGHSTSNNINSAFTGILSDGGTSFTGTYAFPSKRYYDKYSYGTSSTEYTRGKLGDATKEMAPVSSNKTSWYGDYALFVSSSAWFSRGGYYGFGALAGAFCFTYGSGITGADYSARAVLSVSLD